jgi:hypothetical protein
VQDQNYDAVVATDVDLLKNPVVAAAAGAVTMGLRVIDCVLFPIGLLWIVTDRQRRSLQDIVFRRRVVYASGLLAASARVITLLTPGTSPS